MSKYVHVGIFLIKFSATLIYFMEISFSKIIDCYFNIVSSKSSDAVSDYLSLLSKLELNNESSLYN